MNRQSNQHQTSEHHHETINVLKTFFFLQTDEKKALLLDHLDPPTENSDDDNFSPSDDLKPVKLEKSGSNPPISVHMSSPDLLETCEASCIEAGLGNISTSILPRSDDLKDEFEPPRTPDTRLTNDELNPTTTAVYIKDAQVRLPLINFCQVRVKGGGIFLCWHF